MMGAASSEEGNGTGVRLIVASNRLPLVLQRVAHGQWEADSASGGLVTALDPVLRDRRGIWVGWPGGGDDVAPEELEEALEEATREHGYQVHPVPLTADERDGFYLGFSNQVIWPLFHDFPTRCNFDPRFWGAYVAVNRKFAAAIAEVASPDDFVWVHDYHLMGVASELRGRGITGRLGFFLHIPFPHLDLFANLPWRFEILESLLRFDLVGFQADRDRTNFLQCVEAFMPDVAREVDGPIVRLTSEAFDLGVGVFPISIDFDEFASLAASDAVVRRLDRIRGDFAHQRLMLGVDRLDYSKGIVHKLHGYRLALERYPELRRRVTLVQLVVPSREGIPEYDRMKTEIERLVGETQGVFTGDGWVPIHYQYGEWDREELLAHYRACGVALVTPLKDGMNLVAKEYCASRLGGDGVLVLSEHAGAAAQLQEGALLVNPYDVEGLAEAIRRAVTMPGLEQRQRMSSLRRAIRRTDLAWWVRTFLAAAEGEHLGDDARVERFSPRRREGPPGRRRLGERYASSSSSSSTGGAP